LQKIWICGLCAAQSTVNKFYPQKNVNKKILTNFVVAHNPHKIAFFACYSYPQFYVHCPQFLLISKTVKLAGNEVLYWDKKRGTYMNISLNLAYGRGTTELSNTFIDHYMTACPPVYSLLYILSMKKLLNNEPISIENLATQFNITQSDVQNAWAHWENTGLVKLEKSKNDIASITFLPVNSLKEVQPAPAEDVKPQVAESRPQYTTEELAAYRQHSPDVARLFDCASRAMGRLLHVNDMSVVFSFHDWLCLPFDVIEYLFDYCETNGHRNLRYIEKCAMDWADKEITDVETAILYVQSFDKNYRTIMHYMGITGYPTPSHRKYIDRWVGEWQMSLDLIMEAIDRSVAETGKAKPNYANTVLADWHKKGIADIAGVKAADAEFQKDREEKNIVKFDKKAAKVKVNRFANFNQRENDYSKYEQLERAYLEQKLK